MSRSTTALLTLMVCLASLAPVAMAAHYMGWGDTGWGWTSKRQCCNDAVALAHEDAVGRCYDAGGRPRTFAGSRVRGSCSVEWMQEPTGQVVYRCQSETRVACR